MLVSTALCVLVLVFFQAEDGIRDLVRSRGLGDVYKRQVLAPVLLVHLEIHSIGLYRADWQIDMFHCPHKQLSLIHI